LPLTEQSAEVSSPEPVGGNARRVLVIDDNRDAADSMAVLLRLDGHEVAAVYSSEEGLLKTASFAPDIVLLDIGLPQMDGYEVARRLIETGFKGRLIAISGYGEANDKQRAAAAGFFAHLSKPVDYATLARVMGTGSDPNSRIGA
jgi:CheY-like chemotaxis protein